MNLSKQLLTGALICCTCVSSVTAQYNHEVFIPQFPGDPLTGVIPVGHSITPDTKSITAIVQDGAMYTYTVASVREFGNARPLDVFVNGFDQNGIPTFATAYGNENFSEIGNAIIPSSDDDGLIVVGSRHYVDPITNESDPKDGLIFRINEQTGVQDWARTYGVPGEDEVWRGIIEMEGLDNYIVFGYTRNDVLIAARIDAAGNPIWMNRYAPDGIDFQSITPNDIVINSDDNFVISGDCQAPGAFPSYFTFEIDAAGDIQNDFKTFYHGGNQRSSHLIHLNAGGFIAISEMQLTSSSFLSVAAYTEGLDTIVWALGYNFPASPYNEGVSITQTGADLNILLQIQKNFGFLRLDNAGTPLSYRLYNPDNPQQYAASMTQLLGRHFIHGSRHFADIDTDKKVLLMTDNMGNEYSDCHANVEVNRFPISVKRINYDFAQSTLPGYFNSAMEVREKPILVLTCEGGFVTLYPALAPVVTAEIEASIVADEIQQQWKLQFQSEVTSNSTIRVYNGAGQIVYENVNGIIEGNNQIIIPTDKLKAGFYIVQLSGADNSLLYSQKMIK